MDVFLTGGTGVLGRRTVEHLRTEGHIVTVLARSPQNEQVIADLGARPVPGDLFDVASLIEAMSGTEIAINLATNIPPLAKAARARAWETNTRIRTEGSANVVAAAASVGARRVIQESITFTYADGGEDWIDESFSRPAGEFSAPVDVAEENALGFRGDSVVLRFAQLYSTDSEHIRTMAKAYRTGVSPFPGDPGSYTSFVSADDAAAAVVSALGIEPGIYNVADDDPPTRQEVDDEVCAAMGRSGVRRPPQRLMKMMSSNSEVLMRSHRISNAKLEQSSGWSPGHRGAEGISEAITSAG